MPYLSVFSCRFLIIIMPKLISRGKKIAKFIKKLHEILSKQENSDIICWLPQLNGFKILNNSSFVDQVLPKYFKHRNISSFIRQLNIYGFTRPKDSTQNVYMHPKFIKENLNSMRQIQRRSVCLPHHQSEAGTVEIQKSQSRSPHNNEFHQKLSALMDENQKLKKQNALLLQKLAVYRFPFQYANISWTTDIQLLSTQSSKIQNNLQTRASKNQSLYDTNNMHSFKFNNMHNGNIGNLLSYHSLVNGASPHQYYSNFMGFQQ